MSGIFAIKVPTDGATFVSVCRLGNFVVWRLKCSKGTLNVFHYLNDNIQKLGEFIAFIK